MVAAHDRDPALHPVAGLPPSRWDLFSFVGHAPRNTLTQMNVGVLPWWSDPEVKLAFWRPLSAVTHLVDWTLWPRSPLLMHLQSLFWFALALVAVAAFYRRFFAGFGGAAWASGLAILCMRSTTRTARRSAGSPTATRWSRSPPRSRCCSCTIAGAGKAGAPASGSRRCTLAVALGAGESALAVVAYLFAYALCLDDAPLARRASASLVPYVAVVVVWRIVYHALGFGTAYSGVYVDAGAEPLAFLHVMPSRAAYLLAAQLATPWSDFAALWSFVSPHAERNALFFCAIVVALFALLFAPLCRRDRLARFFAVGMLGAVVPICSTFPADRLLWFVGIGAMGLVARWIELRPRAWWAAVVTVLLILIHVVLAAPLLAVRSRSMVTVSQPILRADASLPPSDQLRGGMLVLVNPPSDCSSRTSSSARASGGSAAAADALARHRHQRRHRHARSTTAACACAPTAASSRSCPSACCAGSIVRSRAARRSI